MRGRVVAVVGAAGGVGASTLAALLARRRAVAGDRVLLVDLDPGGGGLDVLLGLEQVDGARWSDLRHVASGVEVRPLLDALPHWRGVSVVSGGPHRTADADGGPEPAVVGAVLDAVAGAGGAVVVDTSVRSLAALPARGELHRGVTASVLVTSQDVVGVAAGLAARPLLTGAQGALVLRARRRPVVASLEAAQAVGLAHAATLPSDRSVASSTDRGLGPVPGRGLTRVVARVDAALAARPDRRAPAGHRRRSALRVAGG